MIFLANAPVSYGVFGLSRPDLVPLPDGPSLLTAVAEAGYQGIDLGPHGYLGKGESMVARLAERGLGLAGGWLDFPFSGSDVAFEAALDQSRTVLNDFVLAAQNLPHPPPLPTIADAGDARRRAEPGGGRHLELPPEEWRIFTARLERVLSEVRDRGLEPTFHHHAATYVETPREIERLLSDSSVDLTLDTGHLILGGGDPLEAVSAWSGRINHLHLKDVSRRVLTEAAGAADMVRAVWEKRVFVPLGEGDLVVADLVEAVIAAGFTGWLVVEQDVVLRDADDVARAFLDQRTNREVLRRWWP